MGTAIEVFLCYAHEDKKYQQRLEKQLSPLQKNGRINLWHNGKINPGEAQQQVTFAHLDTAQIVLLLISSNFMASNYCHRVMEIEEIQTQPPVAPLPSQEPEKSGTNLQHSSLQEEKPSSEKFLVESKAHQEMVAVLSEDVSQADASRCPQTSGDEKNRFGKYIQKHKHRNIDKKRRLLISLFVLLILIFPLFQFLPRPLCFATFCHFSQQSTQQAFPQNEGEVQDQNLAVRFIGTQQNTFALPGNPLKLNPSQLPKQGVPALYANQQKQSSVFRITLRMSNLRRDQYVLLIKQVQIIVEKIASIPHPFYALVQNPPVLSSYNLYNGLYGGQEPGMAISTTYDYPPYTYVFLTLHETDTISIQVASLVEVFLSFRIAITYRVANEGQSHTLPLSKTFQVIFSTRSNWHAYQKLRDGHFVQLDTP